jgi:hypothetical protein
MEDVSNMENGLVELYDVAFVLLSAGALTGDWDLLEPFGGTGDDDVEPPPLFNSKEESMVESPSSIDDRILGETFLDRADFRTGLLVGEWLGIGDLFLVLPLADFVASDSIVL